VDFAEGAGALGAGIDSVVDGAEEELDEDEGYGGEADELVGGGEGWGLRGEVS